MAFYAEGVGNRDPRHAAARRGRARRFAEGGFAGVVVKKVAFEEHQLGAGGHRLRNVVRGKPRGDPKIGVQRAFPIRGHKDHAARGRVLAPGHRRVDKIYADVGHCFGIELTQIIVIHPPDKGRGQAKRADARNGIGDRPAGGLQTVLHCRIQVFRAVPLDQLHNAFFDAVILQKRVIRMRDHIDNSVADANHFVLGHSVFSS